MQVRQVAVGLAGLLAVGILAASASVVMLQGRPAGAAGKPVDPDSIALTARLERYEYDLEDSRTMLVTATASGRTYLVKDDHTALAGADVQFELPQMGIRGTMSPAEPGQYGYKLVEQIRVRSPVSLVKTRGWQVRNLHIEVDGRDETGRVSLSDTTASSRNFTRKDVNGAGLAVFSTPKTYSIKTNTRMSFRVLQADGSPAAGMTATVELPQRGYSEVFTTDGEGWVRIDRVDELLLTIRGGKMVEIQGPIFIEPPQDPATLFWWEDPTPRCDLNFRAQDKRLAVRPGETARFGFEVVNRGNRPDDYKVTVAGVPADWVEVEYGGRVSLFPFFGQVVYVNVTPERSPMTKKGTRTITATVSGSCKTVTAKSDLKVLEFHEGRVDLYGSSAVPGPKLSPELRRLSGNEDGVTVIVLAGGVLPDRARADIEALGGEVRREFSLIDGVSVRIPAGMVSELAKLPWVARVNENKPVQALLDQSVPAVGAPPLWKLGYDGTGVIVAVVDTGVDYIHPALKGHVILGPDFVNNDDDPMDGHGHGTHVAGIIASRDPQRRGVAPGATIMAVKVLSETGSGTEEGVIAGIEWAVLHGARVINLSLGGPAGGGNDALAQVVDNAVKSGVVVAVAAGNGGPDFSTVGSPGDARLALTVGATDNTRSLQDWSSRGPTSDGRTKPDVAAPGLNITSLAPGGKWAAMSGTSMATPHVAGVAALLVQATGAEPLLIRDGLKRTALDLGRGVNASGAGFVRPTEALAYIRRAQAQVQQTVDPGEVAVYDFTLHNQGNVDDRFRMTQWFDDNGLKYHAQPTLPGTAVRSGVESRIGSGTSVVARAQVSVPADWAGMEDAVYRFHLQATSLADRNAAAEDMATVKVKATKRSMSEYVHGEVRDLRVDILTLGAGDAVKADLLRQSDGLADHVQAASAALAARSEALGDEHLDAALAGAQAMDRDAAARRDRGLLRDADATRLATRLKAIREHLTTARGTRLK